MQTDLPLAALGAGAQGVLNCDLRPQGPAALQISFRIGPVRGFGYVPGKFPLGLNGPDRFCRGGSGHSRFHLKGGRHLLSFNRGPGLQRGCNCLVGVVSPAAQAGVGKVGWTTLGGVGSARLGWVGLF
jgi:hypothetical protein